MSTVIYMYWNDTNVDISKYVTLLEGVEVWKEIGRISLL